MKSTSFKINSAGCWEWLKAKAGNGYGVISFNQKMHYSHRVSYRFFVGEIPPSMNVLHRCDNPSCVNPEHLFLGTQKDNVADMIKKGRNKNGQPNPKYKFDDQTVLKIRKDFESGIFPKDLRLSYGISHAQLYRITRYKTRPNLKETK